MFHLFRNRTRRIYPDKTKITETLNHKVDELKIRLAECLTAKTKNWSVRTWKISLILFCTVSATISSYVMIDAWNDSKPGRDYTIVPLVVPKSSAKPDRLVRSRGFVITEQEYNRLKQFDLYMDSLSKSPSGRIKFDSIMKYRYGLLDTIHKIEQMYLLQKK